MKSRDIISPSAVESLIAAGNIIVIVDQRALCLDGWISKHPGGRLAVLHMVGRDATEEVNIYHSAKTLKTMKAFAIGRLESPWVNLTPPIRGGIFKAPEKAACEASTSIALEVPSDIDSILSISSSNSSSDSLHDIASIKSTSAHKPSSPQHTLQKCGMQEVGQESPYQKSHITAGDYTLRLMEDEIAEGIRDYPSLHPAKQRDITMRYRDLHQRVKDEGLYKCRYSEYGIEMIRYSLLFAAFLAAMHYGWYLTGAVFLGFFWHQIMFTAHDAGHRGITHNFVADTLISLFVADFCCGLSMGWWKSSHNVHHLVTNHPEHDPDIQNVPLFATCPSFFKSIRSTYYDFTFAWDAFADKAVKYQMYTYYPVMAVARFNLYFLSIGHLLSPRSKRPGRAAWIRPTEVLFMAFYWYLFGYLLLWRTIPTWSLRVAFVVVSHVVTLPLHIQITLSHWGMPTADLGETESFPQRQLRTTMDVSCPPWLDFIHGGLQFQACHHLFPMVPRHNLRKLQVLVREFCAESDIPYRILGFMDGNRKVLGRLGDISRQVELLVKCQRDLMEQGPPVLH